MKFKEALNHIYVNNKNLKELLTPFYLYCKLSDLCSTSFEEKNKVDLFHQVNSRINIVKAVINKDNNLIKRYNEVEDLISESAFNALIKTLELVLDKNYIYEESIKKKTLVPIHHNKPIQENKNIKNTKITYESDNLGTKIIIWAFLILFIITLIMVLFCWSWTTWQWYIGIVGGILLTVLLVMFGCWIEDSLFSYYLYTIIVLGITSIINTIFLINFRYDYQIIFCCYSVFQILVGSIVVYNAFDEYEEGYGLVLIGEVLLFIVGIILTLVIM